MPFDVPRERFEQFVADALDSLPPELAKQMDNVAVSVAEEPEIRPEKGTLLGLYEGVPLTKRWGYAGATPDRITIYRRTICALANSEDEVREQVRRTVLHEVGHHFGIDDHRLRQLGW